MAGFTLETTMKRKNGDDLLRKLEREAMKTYNLSNLGDLDIQAWLRLWREQIRRGVFPTPNHSGLSTPYWWILPISMNSNLVLGWWPKDGEVRVPHEHLPIKAKPEDVGSYVAKLMDEYERL